LPLLLQRAIPPDQARTGIPVVDWSEGKQYLAVFSNYSWVLGLFILKYCQQELQPVVIKGKTDSIDRGLPRTGLSLTLFGPFSFGDCSRSSPLM
jgi:hypothetical protein